MSDEKYELPRPTEPEPTDKRPHPIRIRLDIVAIGIALVAVGAALAAATFSYKQWQAAERQANILYQELQNSITAFRVEQRPWMSVGEAHLIYKTLTMILHDRGRSPAYDTVAQCSVYKDDGQGLVKQFDMPIQKLGDIESDRFSGTVASIPWSKDNLVAFRTRVKCQISYGDQFKHEYPPLQLCYEMEPSNGTAYFCDNLPPTAH
jgi:hypothetical protein